MSLVSEQFVMGLLQKVYAMKGKDLESAAEILRVDQEG